MVEVGEGYSTGESHDNDDISVDDTEGGVVLLPANVYRNAALIINTGTFNMRVTTDGEDPTATYGKRVVPGGTLSLSSPYCPNKEIKAICEEVGESTTANASEVD